MCFGFFVLSLVRCLIYLWRLWGLTALRKVGLFFCPCFRAMCGGFSGCLYGSVVPRPPSTCLSPPFWDGFNLADAEGSEHGGGEAQRECDCVPSPPLASSSPSATVLLVFFITSSGAFPAVLFPFGLRRVCSWHSGFARVLSFVGGQTNFFFVVFL